METEEIAVHLGAVGNGRDEFMPGDYQRQVNQRCPRWQWLAEDTVP